MGHTACSETQCLYKGALYLSLKKPQNVGVCRKKVTRIYPIRISKEVITSGNVRKGIKKTMSKTCERQERARKKKTMKKKKRRVMILNN
jgi:hypothetical protein